MVDNGMIDNGMIDNVMVVTIHDGGYGMNKCVDM